MNAILAKDGELFAPEPRGKADLLTIGREIALVGAVDEGAAAALSLAPEVLDAAGCWVVPGFVDQHVHINGAGGEGGPRFRTAPLQLPDFIRAGVTTVAGLLGNDGVCRSLRDLYMKTRALDDEGITAFMYTGSYQLPGPTLTGGVIDDLCLIDKVIGLKIAVAEQKASHPTVEQIRRAVSDTRVGGLLGGKAGLVVVHMGGEPAGCRDLFAALEGTQIPAGQFVITHAARLKHMFDDAIAFAKAGGQLDITAFGVPASVLEPFDRPAEQTILDLLAAGVPLAAMTLSSDGNGCLPRFDEQGRLVGVGKAPLNAMFQCFRRIVRAKLLPMEQALALCTSLPADRLRLPHKGRLGAGKDGDFLVIDRKSLELRHVVAKGRVLLRDGVIAVRSAFGEEFA